MGRRKVMEGWLLEMWKLFLLQCMYLLLLIYNT